MIDGAFVFDAVSHIYNMGAPNVKNAHGHLFNRHLYGFHQALTPSGEKILCESEFLREWAIDDIAQIVFGESQTDMLIAQPLPLTDFFEDGLSSWRKCAEMAARFPDRVLSWGTVNPLEGARALEQMEVQVREFGVKGFKLYNVRYDFGEPFPWRMDDRRIAYPIFEKAQQLGIDVVAVHKGVPLGPQPIDGTRVSDLDQAAVNFPNIRFVVFHPGLPFIDEICWQLVRFPNVYVSLAASVNFIAKQPRWFAETLGKLLFWGGPDRILTGSEAPLWHPRWALEAFSKFTMPADLIEGYSYPQLTGEIKRKILGENLARLMGVDIEEKKRKLQADAFGEKQRASLAQPWSHGAEVAA